ncbi:hypothetical protein KEJ21_00475 [Candidatus Bathyarchaeota archaeon]|nr:hypothetical protein [Candidatus Bathyarchaeota archaeon]MBS7630036.1 hypothetical protein [Candidatus Bathyarchaeota archaeon]
MIGSESGQSTKKFTFLTIITIALGISSALSLYWIYKLPKESINVEKMKISPILYTDKEKYNVGDPIRLGVVLSNEETTRLEVVRVEYNLTIFETEQKIYETNIRYEFGRPIIIEPNSTYWIPTGQSWNQRDLLNRQVPEGRYLLVLTLLPYNQTASKIVVINNDQ